MIKLRWLDGEFTQGETWEVYFDGTDIKQTAGISLTDIALLGNPTAPTQSAGNNSTRIANTAFVTAAINVVLGGV